jgi:hypothetical protein
MPIYEYACEKCRRTTSVLTTRVSEKVDFHDKNHPPMAGRGQV